MGRERDASGPAVIARELAKHYRVSKAHPGFLGSLRQLVSREFRDVRAVDGITFEIPRGQFVGYIGPNGAGKSTTVKMLTGILHPSSGSVFVNGLSPQRQREALMWDIGVVFGQRTQLWWDLPARDSFELLAAMYEVPRPSYLHLMKQLSDLLGLDEFLDMPVRRLSLGQRMRADLACALIHKPSVLFLDEPTIGLDVMAKSRIREFLSHINQHEGCTILLTSHDLRDIEELCERVMIINHGQLLFDGTLGALREHAGLPTVLKAQYPRLPENLRTGLFIDSSGHLQEKPANGVWQIVAIDQSTQIVSVAFDRNLSPAPKVLWAMQAFGEVKDVSLSEPLIEDVIKRLLSTTD